MVFGFSSVNDQGESREGGRSLVSRQDTEHLRGVAPGLKPRALDLSPLGPFPGWTLSLKGKVTNPFPNSLLEFASPHLQSTASWLRHLTGSSSRFPS